MVCVHAFLGGQFACVGDFVNLDDLLAYASEVVIGGRLCVRAFIGGECVCVASVYVVLCNLKKKE